MHLFSFYFKDVLRSMSCASTEKETDEKKEIEEVISLVWVALVWVRSLMCGRPCSLCLLGVLLISPFLGSPSIG